MAEAQINGIDDFNELIEVTDDNDLFEGSDDEGKDSSLKELYSEQTFISFEILEQCLK